MKKLKQSSVMKFFAWITLMISANIFLISTVAMILMADYGFYNNTTAEVRNKFLEQVNRSYSAQALAWMGQGKGMYFAERDFQYGIVKMENWEEGNLKDPAIYEEYNFIPALVEEGESSIFIDNVTENTLLSSYENMWGDTEYYLETMMQGPTYLYAEKIVYDEGTGVLYYLSNDVYYPVKKVQVNFTYQDEPAKYIYEYQFDKETYCLTDKWISYIDGAAHKDYLRDVDVDDVENAKRVMASVLACEEYGGEGADFDFRRFENTGYGFFNLEEMVLDDVRAVSTSRIDAIDSRKMSNFEIRKVDDYSLNEHYTLVVREQPEMQKYVVISKIPESFNIAIQDNPYVVANQRFEIAYKWHLAVFWVMGISAVIVLISFVFLINSAGHKRNEDELVLRFMDKLPLEIYASIMIFAGLMCVPCLSEIGYHTIESILFWVLGAFIIFVMEIIAVCFILGIAVRVKTHTLWKNTLIYRVCHRIAEAWRYFTQNIGFVWKAVLGFAVVDGFLMLWVFVMACNSYDPEIFFFVLLVDILIAVIYFIAVVQMNQLQEASKRLAQGNLDYKIDTNKMFWEFKKHGENLNAIGNGITLAVEERMKSEHFKTELITNVSHDIKTPLTSIINYVDLLSKEDLQNEEAAEYIEVLQRQSSKLKKLIEDLVEASKASTGNLTVNMEKLEAGVFLTQTVGEFEEKFAENGLELIIHKPEEPVYICADGRHLWRVVDNLMNNILKYAQPLSRVYIHLEEFESRVTLTFRNISKDQLNLTADEFKERFIRGDKSRNTEGHGLGLAIAQSLMDLMKAELTILVDGDLFKVILTFAKEESMK